MKHRLWWYQFPEKGSPLWIKSEVPVNEQEVRKDIREHFGMKRLPKGTEVWPMEKQKTRFRR